MTNAGAIRSVVLVLLVVMVAGLFTGCFRRGRRPGAAAPVLAGSNLPVPPVEESPVDYPTFRRTFRTQLRWAGLSPQNWAPVPVPAGVRAIEYTSDGETLTAWVNEDAARPGSKRPAVLWLHGGFAFAREDWDQTEAFRRAGYHVLVPILRGENGQPGTFTLFAEELTDALSAADALARLPGVDAENLFVAGHEAGGTLALLAVLSTDRFRAAAAISALPDCGRLVALRPDLAPFDTTSPDEITLRSPSAFAAYLRCPVRLYFGSAESAHVEDDNLRLAERARTAGRDTESIRVPGDLLTCVPPATRQAVDFFNQSAKKSRSGPPPAKDS